jgi:hypothetical protein
MMATLRNTLEYLGGERDDSPYFLSGRYNWVVRCIVWAAAIILIYSFSGQSSKFIYIDF